jgi:hypothetical protein
MMLRTEVTPRDGSQPGVLRRKSRAGPAFLGAFAGVAVLGVGTVAATLVGIHSTPALASSVCQTLPTAPSSPPPGPTPSVSAGGSASGSGSGAGSAAAAAPAATQLCVTVTATTSTVKPGQSAQYTIDVEPTGGAASDVTVQISASGSFPAPAFSVCGAGDGTQTCTLGGMRANKPTEVQAQDAVPSSASSGSSVTLTARVTGVATGATTQGSVSGIASVQVVAPPSKSPKPSKSGSTSPSHHSDGHGHHHGGSGGHSGDSGSGGDSGVGTNDGSGLGSNLGTGLGTKLGYSPGSVSPGGNLNPLAGLTGSGSGANPSNLFPTINPSPTASGTGGSPPGAAPGTHDPYHPTTVADVLPLNNGQVGGQVAGLAVLALGIIVAVVRVSVRKPRTQGKQ